MNIQGYPFIHRAIALLLLLGFNSTLHAGQQAFDPELRDYLAATIHQSSSFEDRFDAEVWLLDMSTRLKRYVKDPEERLQILRLVHKEATQLGIEPELILSVMHVESLFKRFAISRVGAQGIMQVMPFWLDEIGEDGDNLMNLETNIRMGSHILKFYLDKEKGNKTRALARYNGSLGSTKYPTKVFKALKRYWYPN